MSWVPEQAVASVYVPLRWAGFGEVDGTELGAMMSELRGFEASCKMAFC